MFVVFNNREILLFYFIFFLIVVFKFVKYFIIFKINSNFFEMYL